MVVTQRARQPYAGFYESSLANLDAAFDPAESAWREIQVFDNSAFNRDPKLALIASGGLLIAIADIFPIWLQSALGWSQSDLQNARRELTG